MISTSATVRTSVEVKADPAEAVRVFTTEIVSQLGKLQARSDGRSLGGDPDCGRAGFRVCPLGGEDPPQQGNRLPCAQRRKGYSGRTVPDGQAAELAAASDKDQAGLRVKVADHTKHGRPQ